MASPEAQGLASFGIVLTGRLELKNEFLSTLSVGKEVWEDRYVVLTLKGLHYYVRQPGKDASRRDLFGQHDGSVGLSNIARIEAAREEGAKGGERDYLTSITIVSKGGRHYHFRAKTPQLLTRWYSALENAIAPTPKPSTTSSHLSLSQLSRSASGRHLTTFSSRVQGGSFHRAPTFIDFRTAVPTDNLVYLSLKSAKLKLEVLLESGMPWGIRTPVEFRLHYLDLQRDSFRVLLEGGASATVPLNRTLSTSNSGSTLIQLQSPSLHKRIRLKWEPLPPLEQSDLLSGLLKNRARTLGIFAALLLASTLGLVPQAASKVLGMVVMWPLQSLSNVLLLLLLLLQLPGHPPNLPALPPIFKQPPRGFAISFEPSEEKSREPEEAKRGEGERQPPSPSPPYFSAQLSSSTLADQQGEKGQQEKGQEELRVDALFAEMTSEEHSILYGAARALHDVMKTSVSSVMAETTTPRSPEGSPEPAVQLASTAGWEDDPIDWNLEPTSAASTPMGMRAGAAPASLMSHFSLSPASFMRSTSPRTPRFLRRSSSFASSPPSSSLSPACVRQVCNSRMHSGDGMSAVACDKELQMSELLVAFEAMVNILAAIGPALMIQVRNDNANMGKLRAAMASTGCSSLRALLQAEVSQGVHKQGAVKATRQGREMLREGGATLADPSGAMALLWLTRSLHFTLVLAEGLLAGAQQAQEATSGLQLWEGQRLLDTESSSVQQGESDITTKAIKRAYSKVIRPYHSWLLRKTFNMCASQAPEYAHIVDLLGSGLGDADRETQILHDMRLFCSAGFPVVEIIQQIFEQLLLEDLHKV